MWLVRPWRARMISRKVCALGAFRLTSMARIPKSMIWMVAPEAYQKGPETPYWKATLDDCRSVAAQVHCETMTEAVSPILMLRPAVLNDSELCFFPMMNRSSIFTTMVVIRLKAKPNSTTIRYPVTWLYGGSDAQVTQPTWLSSHPMAPAPRPPDFWAGPWDRVECQPLSGFALDSRAPLWICSAVTA